MRTDETAADTTAIETADGRSRDRGVDWLTLGAVFSMSPFGVGNAVDRSE